MIADYPYSSARLTVSAVFSIGFHAFLLMLVTGLTLFPRFSLSPPAPLEVVIASYPSEEVDEESLLEADKNQAGDKLSKPLKNTSTPSKPKETRSVKTQGNAQWMQRPAYQDEQAWKGLSEVAPNKHRTVSAATHEARDAAYLARWRDRVETLGTKLYQSKLKTKPLSGEVRILVSIGPQGQMLNAQIRQSSGQPALDGLALEILRKAAPFEPLTAEMQKDTEVLEIIRTWKFTAREGLRSG